MVAAIILAAGRGRRMDTGINKQYLLLKDKPVLAHTLGKFQSCSLIDEIVLVIGHEEEGLLKEQVLKLFKTSKPIKVVIGGDSRQESVMNGLLALSDPEGVVVIHDGARPLVCVKTIEACIAEAGRVGAVSAGVPVKDTIKVVHEDGYILDTPKRKSLWITQTPQAFKQSLIAEAHAYAIKQSFEGTDDAMLVERLGHKVYMVEASYKNIKITTPEDLIMAEMLLGTE